MLLIFQDRCDSDSPVDSDIIYSTAAARTQEGVHPGNASWRATIRDGWRGKFVTASRKRMNVLFVVCAGISQQGSDIIITGGHTSSSRCGSHVRLSGVIGLIECEDNRSFARCSISSERAYTSRAPLHSIERKVLVFCCIFVPPILNGYSDSER
jgi:hypothetical protein